MILCSGVLANTYLGPLRPEKREELGRKRVDEPTQGCPCWQGAAIQGGKPREEHHGRHAHCQSACCCPPWKQWKGPLEHLRQRLSVSAGRGGGCGAPRPPLLLLLLLPRPRSPHRRRSAAGRDGVHRSSC
eukprot:1151616-Pelagomonas_calceolata.AAC.5